MKIKTNLKYNIFKVKTKRHLLIRKALFFNCLSIFDTRQGSSSESNKLPKEIVFLFPSHSSSLSLLDTGHKEGCLQWSFERQPSLLRSNEQTFETPSDLKLKCFYILVVFKFMLKTFLFVLNFLR